MSRPERNPAQKLIIQQSATEIAELRRNNRLIYGGALADGRALRGQDGVYTVKVLPPLEVTHLGIALNMHDPMFRINVLGTGSSVPELVQGLAYGMNTGGSAGDGPGMAREDHMHALVLAGGSCANVGLTTTGTTMGTGITPARSDHVHFHNQPVLNNTQTVFYAPTAFEAAPQVYILAKEVDESWDDLDHMAIVAGDEKKIPVVDGRTSYPPTGHSFLGNKHTDTVPSPPTKGDLVYATSGTPSKWDDLGIGSQGAVLSVAATDLPAWQQIADDNTWIAMTVVAGVPTASHAANGTEDSRIAFLDNKGNEIVLIFDAMRHITGSKGNPGDGGIQYATTAAKTAAYTATINDDVITCGAGDETFAVSLPTAVNAANKVLEIKNVGTGVITIEPNGAETIDGESSVTLNVQGESLTLVSDSTEWWVI